MPNKIKIAFLNDTMGPYHYARLEAANILSDCTFIEFSNKDHTNYWDTSSKKFSNKVTLFEDKTITEKTKNEISERLNEVLDAIKPDVVLVSGWDAVTSLLGLKWCNKNNIPSILLSESQAHDFKRSFLKEYVKKQLLKLFDSAFVGGRNQIEYLSSLGVPLDQIFPGCDFVDNEYFKKNSNIQDELRQGYLDKFGLPTKFFFTSCRFIEKKNLKFLITAFNDFLTEDSEWSLVIAGDGPLKNDLVDTVSSLKISDKVFFPGYVQYDQIPIIYGLSSCFILPSTIEQWGLVVNESLACGKPVLVSDKCGSAPNLVENRDVGYIFNPLDKDDLVSKMKMITIEGNLKMFSHNAANIMSEFDGNHYSLNLNNAAKKAISTHNRNQNFFSMLVLRCLILFSK